MLWMLENPVLRNMICKSFYVVLKQSLAICKCDYTNDWNFVSFGQGLMMLVSYEETTSVIRLP
jgi:hypothetical protein